MKVLTLITFLTLGLTPLFAQDEEDFILWGDKELEWVDFKGEAEKNSGFHALTYSQMHAPNSWNSDSLHVEITTKFIPGKSWALENGSNNLLKHEQLHFDITEYHTRLFRKALLSYRFSKIEEVGNEVAELFYKFHDKSRAMQSEYDHETDHSKNKEAQEKWNQKIADLLESTKDYRQTELHIYIGYLE